MTRHWHLAAALALAGGLGGTGPVQADGQGLPAPPLGEYQGGGHACQGRLVLTARTVSWNSSFSRCGRSPYRVVSAASAVGAASATASPVFVFELAKPSAGCRHESISLRQTGADAFEAIGYPSAADRDAKRMDEALVCPMVKLR
jgi:hypothetical protein